MTISSTDNKVNHAPDGIITVFAYGFRVDNESDMNVLLDDVDQPTGWTISGLGNPAGGNVTFAVAPVGSVLTLLREVPLTQAVDYSPYDAFPAETHEGALDKLTMQVQQLAEVQGRTAKAPASDDGTTDFTLPAYAAGKGVMWDPVLKKLIVTDDNPNDVAAATAADVVTTNADVVITNADVVITNADVVTTTADVLAAAASAAAAAAAVSSIAWSDVVYKTFADSPVTLVDADNGKMFNFDCSGGNIVVNLPDISALTLTEPWAVGTNKYDSGANSFTLTRNGTDTINGGTTLAISNQNAGATLVPDTDNSPDEWLAMIHGTPANVLLDSDINVTVQAHDADTAKTDVAQEFTAQQNFDASALVDGANISWNLNTKQETSVILGGNRTLDNPTNMKDGTWAHIIVTQDGTGSRTLSYGTAYKFGDAGAPTLTTAANGEDILSFRSDGTNMKFAGSSAGVQA